MKRTITITFPVDAAEYHECEDSTEGTIELVRDMINGGADFPDTATITCEGVSKTIDVL